MAVAVKRRWLTPAQVEDIRTSGDTKRALAERHGVSPRTVTAVRNGHSLTDYVANEPFRRRFEELREREGLNFNQLALRAGWVRRDRPGMGDTSYVQHLLGLRGSANWSVTERVSYAAALKLCEAMNMEPHEVGL